MITTDLWSYEQTGAGPIFGSGALRNAGIYCDFPLTIQLDNYTASSEFREVFKFPVLNTYAISDTCTTCTIYLYDTIRDVIVDPKNYDGILSQITVDQRSTQINIPESVREFRVVLQPKYNSTLLHPLSSVKYTLLEPVLDEEPEDIRNYSKLITNGLSPVRTQQLATRGLALNGSTYRDTYFSVKPYLAQHFYDNPAMKQFLDFTSDVLGSKIDIIKQLKLFNSRYDNFNEYAAYRYGVPPYILDNDYIKNVLFKYKSQLQSLTYLWKSKTTYRSLLAGLKLFCDVHPFSTLGQEKLGWYLTQASGWTDAYYINDFDILTWSTNSGFGDTSYLDYADRVVFGADAQENNAVTGVTSGGIVYNTEVILNIKLDYFIDLFGNKQNFENYYSIDELLTGYAYGKELIDAVYFTTQMFLPVQSDVNLYWVNSDNKSVNMYVSHSTRYNF